AVEEQFYIVWPFAVLFCSRRVLTGICIFFDHCSADIPPCDGVQPVRVRAAARVVRLPGLWLTARRVRRAAADTVAHDGRQLEPWADDRFSANSHSDPVSALSQPAAAILLLSRFRRRAGVRRGDRRPFSRAHRCGISAAYPTGFTSFIFRSISGWSRIL